VGGLVGSLFGLGKNIAGKSGCTDPSPTDILKSVKDVKSGIRVINLFADVFYECSDLARVFIPSKPFQPNMMFVGKAR
jgi:hypothetical protein